MIGETTTPTEVNNLNRYSLFFLRMGILAGTGVLLSSFAFSRKSRREIVERDGNRCTICGATEHLEACHIDHNKNNPNYDNPNNGFLACVVDHLIDHRDRAGSNGLTRKQNDWAIKKLEERIDDYYA